MIALLVELKPRVKVRHWCFSVSNVDTNKCLLSGVRQPRVNILHYSRNFSRFRMKIKEFQTCLWWQTNLNWRKIIKIVDYFGVSGGCFASFTFQQKPSEVSAMTALKLAGAGACQKLVNVAFYNYNRNIHPWWRLESLPDIFC